MKAKIKPRINLDDRTPLETVIPLSTPFIIFIDPASVCNFKCSFCPTGNKRLIKETGRWQGLMDFELYKKAIDDLQEFDKPLKVLRLYKEGEPFLNSRFADMIRYAKESEMVQYIDTTTNGYLLEAGIIENVIDAGIDKINISVDGLSDQHFFEFTGVRVDFTKFVENIKILYEVSRGSCEISIKIVGDFLSKEEKQFFYDTFGNYADRIFIENIAPCWPEFDIEEQLDVNITKGIYNQEIQTVNTCPYIFYSMSMNSDGSVSLCFLDWAHKQLIGDVRQESLKKIWLGKKMFNYQLEQLQGEISQNSICSKCSQLSHCLPDNIDPYVDELLERLLASQHE